MEKQTRGIVVGYDGSTSAAHAVEWAVHEAKRRGRPLAVLSVVDYGGLGYAGPVGLAHWWPQVALEAGTQLSSEGAERARGMPRRSRSPRSLRSARQPPSSSRSRARRS